MTLTDTETEIILAALEGYASNLYMEKSQANGSLTFVKENGGTPGEVSEKELALQHIDERMATAKNLKDKFTKR